MEDTSVLLADHTANSLQIELSRRISRKELCVLQYEDAQNAFIFFFFMTR